MPGRCSEIVPPYAPGRWGGQPAVLLQMLRDCASLCPLQIGGSTLGSSVGWCGGLTPWREPLAVAAAELALRPVVVLRPMVAFRPSGFAPARRSSGAPRQNKSSELTLTPPDLPA